MKKKQYHCYSKWKAILKIKKFENFGGYKECKDSSHSLYLDWSQNMCPNGTYLIQFMHHKTRKPSNLAQIDPKALATSLTFILEIYIKFKGKQKRVQVEIILDFEIARRD